VPFQAEQKGHPTPGEASPHRCPQPAGGAAGAEEPPSAALGRWTLAGTTLCPRSRI